MFYPEEIIEQVRFHNDIVDIVSGYVKLERKGKRYFGLCPFHNEKTPSFSIEPAKQLFYCFGCNKGGTVIQFIMNIEGLNFVDALQYLAERAGIKLPEPDDRKEREKAKRRKEIIELNKEAARYFFTLLAGDTGKHVQRYLKLRGLSSKIIHQFGLGFSPTGWSNLTDLLLSKGASPEVLISSGLTVKSQNGELVDRFRNRLMFPIFDIRGNVIGFGGRVIDDSRPKYINSPDTMVYNKSRELYGLHFARQSKSKRLLIVEGYMDVLSLHQAGIDYAVASLGTALTSMHAWILKKYADEVIIGFDTDTAGQAATLRGLDILEKTGCKVKVLLLPDGKDPDEYIRNNGPEKFKNLVDGAVSLLEYKIRVQAGTISINNIEDKLNLLNGIADILAAHDNSIEREFYTRSYSEKYGISFASLESEVQKRMKKIKSIQKRESYLPRGGGYQKNQNLQRIDGELEYMLLVILCNDNTLYEMLKERYPAVSFKDEEARKAAVKLYSRLEDNKSCVLVEFLDGLEPVLASYLVHLAETKCEFEDNEKAMADLLNKLKILELEELQKQTIERIKNESNGIKRQELGLEFSNRAEQIAELKKMK
jgi:DNA primase